AWTEGEALTTGFRDEYLAADEDAHTLSPPVLPDELTPDERRQAHRALKGPVLRQEGLSEDEEGALATVPQVVEAAYAGVRRQPRDGERPAAFRGGPPETLPCAYDLDLQDVEAVPDPRRTHALVLEGAAYGTVRKSAVV